jgi:hypothetical protein
MTKFKYVKKGVKRKHQVIEGILPILEEIASIEGVSKVIPAEISYSPTRRIKAPSIRITRETKSGFKLLAHSKGSIQEIFVVVKGKREEVRSKIESLNAYED